MEEQPSIDAVLSQEGEKYGDLDLPDIDKMFELSEEQQAELEELPLAGFPTEEAERRREWLKLPREARAAIRQLHKVLGHKPRNVILQILKGAKAPEEYIQAAKLYRCDACVETAPNTQTHKVSAPKPYIFNHEVIMDVLGVKDANADR